MTSTSGLERPIQYKGTGTLYVQYTIEYQYVVVPSVWASEGFPHYILMVEHLHGQCGKLPRFFILFPPPFSALCPFSPLDTKSLIHRPLANILLDIDTVTNIEQLPQRHARDMCSPNKIVLFK